MRREKTRGQKNPKFFVVVEEKKKRQDKPPSGSKDEKTRQVR